MFQDTITVWKCAFRWHRTQMLHSPAMFVVTSRPIQNQMKLPCQGVRLCSWAYGQQGNNRLRTASEYPGGGVELLKTSVWTALHCQALDCWEQQESVKLELVDPLTVAGEQPKFLHSFMVDSALFHTPAFIDGYHVQWVCTPLIANRIYVRHCLGCGNGMHLAENIPTACLVCSSWLQAHPNTLQFPSPEASCKHFLSQNL